VLLTVHASTPTSPLLANTWSIERDLDFVVYALERLVEVPTVDYQMTRALWTAAVVAHARCFQSGNRRLGLKYEYAKTHRANVARVHQSVCEQRDKSIAHPINGDDEVVITFGVEGEGEALHLMGVGAVMKGLASPTPEGIRDFLGLVRAILEETRLHLHELKRQVMAEGRRLSPEQIRAALPSPPIGTGREDTRLGLGQARARDRRPPRQR